jgi:hypothetical protein
MLFPSQKIYTSSDQLPFLHVKENAEIYVDYLNKLITKSFQWETSADKYKIQNI